MKIMNAAAYACHGGVQRAAQVVDGFTDRASRTKKDEEAELFVKMVKRLAKGFGFKLCDRIKFEDPETGKKYV